MVIDMRTHGRQARKSPRREDRHHQRSSGERRRRKFSRRLPSRKELGKGIGFFTRKISCATSNRSSPKVVQSVPQIRNFRWQVDSFGVACGQLDFSLGFCWFRSVRVSLFRKVVSSRVECEWVAWWQEKKMCKFSFSFCLLGAGGWGDREDDRCVFFWFSFCRLGAGLQDLLRNPLKYYFIFYSNIVAYFFFFLVI